MDLKHNVLQYIKNPKPFWILEFTNGLVDKKWHEIKNSFGINPNEYCTAICINSQSKKINKFVGAVNNINEIIYIEPAMSSLNSFYEEHGLLPCSTIELETKNAHIKIKSAIKVLELVEPVYDDIFKLVRSMQILKQEDSEIDVSYSHPKIPFSIFVSVCEDDSVLSNIRVAESILHEAMHLKLTLIEDIVPLIKPNSDNLFFSPWRNEKRPAQGVLHGLYVFSALLKFYSEILLKIDCSSDTKKFLAYRIEDIERDLKNLNTFKDNNDLTTEGKGFVSILLG